MSVQLSLIDRLVSRRRDPDHKRNLDKDGYRTCADMDALLRRNLMEDLLALLNTRQMDALRLAEIPAGMKQVRRSMILYGLPDFSEVTEAGDLPALIKTAIQTFEPRLLVSVESLEPEQAANAGAAGRKVSTGMRFRINARVELDSGTLPLDHPPEVEIDNGQIRIRKEPNAGR